MTISFSATNPCHMYPLATAVSELGASGCYYSGYPRWKLAQHGPAPARVRTHSLRTNIVYGLLRIPERWRPRGRTLFRWQDDGFDRWVGRHLEPCDFLHAIPGQAQHAFRAARRLGVRTVLNHATGPVRQWVEIMTPEYERVGLRLQDWCPYDQEYFAREDEEYALTQWHAAASSVVREQLEKAGVKPSRIWQVPYGANPLIFHPGATRERSGFRIVFAGQVGLRKGLKTLLDALTLSGGEAWSAHFYGAVLPEAQHDLQAYRGQVPLTFYGPVPAPALAEGFRSGHVLVLPSLEEGFGLVVPQALACGLPALVSERVGAKDLVRHRDNGSVFPARQAEALAAELSWWAGQSRRPVEKHGWEGPARTLVALSASAC